MARPLQPTQQKRNRTAALLQLAGLLALADPLFAQGASQHCPGTAVIVQSADPLEAADICHAATMATSLLSRCGIARDLDLVVRLVEEVRHPCGAAVLGQYLANEDRIELTTFSGCIDSLGPDNAYRQIPLREAWRSLAVHEITHGIASCAARNKKLAPMAQEYIAYTIQILSLPVASRQKLLDAIPGKPPSGTSSFNELYHAIAPLRFGVDAYRHYSAMPDGCAFLNQVLRGEVEFPIEEE